MTTQLGLFDTKTYTLRKWWSWSRHRGNLWASVTHDLTAANDDEAKTAAVSLLLPLAHERDEHLWYLFCGDVAVAWFTQRKGSVKPIGPQP